MSYSDILNYCNTIVAFNYFPDYFNNKNNRYNDYMHLKEMTTMLTKWNIISTRGEINDDIIYKSNLKEYQQLIPKIRLVFNSH